MKPLWWMILGSVVSWLCAAAVLGERASPELLYGMAGPLVAAVGTWLVTVRTSRVNPAGLTGVMVVGMAVKALFFAVYVAVMLRGLDLRPRPFVISFTVYFIALYGIEALLLRRVFADAVARAAGD
jgi:hypothetical protein